MASIFINGTAGANSFELILPDGTKNFAPNYEAFSFGDQVQVNHKYETVSNIAGPSHYSEYDVNGKSDWANAKELVNSLNAIINFSKGGGGGASNAAQVTVDDSGFTNLEGTNVQDVLSDIDEKIGQGGGDSVADVQVNGESVVDPADKIAKITLPDSSNTVTFDENGNILAGETLLGQFSESVETWGNESTHTSIASFDRPEVINPPKGVKQTIENPDLLTWANGNADFKDPSPKGWRIPTSDEIVALDAAGRGDWTQLNGINGRYLGGGTNIFFPAAGIYSSFHGTISSKGTYGNYWSSTARNNNSGKSLFFYDIVVRLEYEYGYINGLTVRCVRDITTTDFEPCPAGEYQIGNIVWAKSNLSDVATFAQNAEDYGAYFQWGQNIAIGGDGQPLSIRHKIAYLEDIPAPTPSVRFNVTNMFTFNPSVPDTKVWMRDDGQQKPEIEIIANNSGNDTNDLIITAASGFGSWYNMTGNKALQALGRDTATGASGIYDVTITGETDVAQTVITVPKEIDNFHGIYFLGQTSSRKASYFVDLNNISYPFELDNTSLQDLSNRDGDGNIIINGVNVDTYDMNTLVIGDSYLSCTSLPDDCLTYFGRIRNLDLSGFKNVINLGEFSLCIYRNYTSTANGISSELNIGSWDASNITLNGPSTEYFMNEYEYEDLPRGIIKADTQELAEKFILKFPSLQGSTIVVNS